MIPKQLDFFDTLFPETEESSQVETTHQPTLELENKRYEGCKQKIAPWIMKKIEEYTSGSTFCDLFGGTGIITKHALSRYDRIIINDFLYSNKVIYDAFFGTGDWDKQKVLSIISTFNNISPQAIPDNYYSDNYGGKYFEMSAARIIGYIRDEIERIKPYLTPKEYAILLASLLYSMDRVAITCGHYDSYRHSGKPGPAFELRLVNAQCHPQVEILREDANEAVKHIKCDIMYIDPPYNSRQYSRHYHVLENIIKNDKPELDPISAKPPFTENNSAYCRKAAHDAFRDLIAWADAKYIVVSYNNTENPKSNTSKNKMTLSEIKEMLSMCGETKVFSHGFKPFNTGKTEFSDHREYLFITKIDNEKRSVSFADILHG